MELLRPLADANYPAATVSYTGTAGSTSTWGAGPQGVVVWSSTPAYTPIPFTVPPGTGAPWRVSAIRVTDSGDVYCKPINIR